MIRSLRPLTTALALFTVPLLLAACANDKTQSSQTAHVDETTPTQPAQAQAAAGPASAQARQPGQAPSRPPRGFARPGEPTQPETADGPTPGPAPRFAEPTNIFSPITSWRTPNDVRTASGEPGPEYWQQRADYNIDATLNADNNEITGYEVVTYTNNAPVALDFIWIHLEQNIFREDSLGSITSPSASIAMREPSGDGCRIESMTSGGRDLEYHVYDTLCRVDLDKPIAANGGKFVFDVKWRFTVPDNTFRRFGIEHVGDGTIYEVAQWFPAVAVFDDVQGWNTLPYLGTGEFYTNFGDFNVNITVPRSHIVQATGVLQNPEDLYTQDQLKRIAQARASDQTVVIRTAEEAAAHNDRPVGEGPLTWRYKAHDVRTFAWASSDAFIYDGCNLDGVFVQSVYPKEATPVWSESTQMLKVAIKGYNNRWFKYPYPEATNVNGPEGGMEYPMIIFCGSRGSDRGLYGVTTHEIGHNWFPMIVNTDERRYAWMDEGFNTFINYYSTPDWFGGEPSGRGDAGNMGRWMSRSNQPPIFTHADKLTRGALSFTQYSKTGAGLVYLREVVLGEERFDRAFREYIRRWAFKSPQPEDFFRTMENVAGDDLAWFWRGWFYTNAALDLAAADVTQNTSADGTNSIAFQIQNLSDFVSPVIFDVTYADGTVERHKLPVEIWYPTNDFTTRWTAESQVVKIQIDPDTELPDFNRRNDTWTAQGFEEPQAEQDQPPARGRRPAAGGGGAGSNR